MFIGSTELKLKLQFFGYLMRRTDSLEKTLVLGKIEGRRRRRWHRMKWLDDITDSMDMNLGKLTCLSSSLRVRSNSCPLSWWYNLNFSSSAASLSFCLQSFPAPGSFPVSRLFTSGGQSIGASASASVLATNIKGWFPLGLTGLISLLSKGLSRVFSSTTVWKHQVFNAQPRLWSTWSSSHTWLMQKLSVQFSHSVVSDSLRPHESQQARPPCPSPTPQLHLDWGPSSQWCHPAV